MAVDDQATRGLLADEHEDRRLRDSYELSDTETDADDTETSIDATEFLDSDPLHAGSEDSHAAGRVEKPKTRLLRGWPVLPGLTCLPRRWSRSRCCMVALVVGGVVFLLTAASGGFVYKKLVEEPPYGQSPPWYPTPRGGTAHSWAASYAKASDMVRRMTLPEKVNVTTGVGWEMGLAVGSTGPAVHVGFPQLNLQDGPLGIRMADNITALPAGVTVGATWNPRLMYEHGRVHAEEARAKGVHALLGPCVGPLGRMPAGGRAWEGFGPDPYLQGVAGAQTIRGIQDQGIMATIKHFVANEQEHFRQPYEWGLPHAVSANIDDRTLHEMYAWPFADAVKAGVASVMCSYNQVNNSYACGNSKLLNGLLKDELGFQGFVMSDWLAQRSGVSTALAGLDMTMPGDGLRWMDGRSLWGPELTRAVLNGSVPLDRLNDMATRIIAAWYQMGQDEPDFFRPGGSIFDPPNFSSWTDERTGVWSPGSPSPQDTVVVNQFVNAQSADHAAVAHDVAVEGIVLLKNDDDMLPLGTDGRSSSFDSSSTTKKTKIGIFGEDAGPGQGPNFCKDRGCNQGTLGSGWGSGAVEFPYLVTPADALVEALDADRVDLHLQTDRNSVHDAETVLAGLDLCFVFANADAGEGYMAWGGMGGDRNDLLLQKGGDDLVYTVATNCGGDVVVVVHAVGPVVMERWIDLPRVKAVLHAQLPGQESGRALADVLLGRVSPSGKLPYTLGRTLEDYGPGARVMYVPNGVVPQQTFSEGLYVDYRHFDRAGIAPRFAFGHGLSYTTFALGNLTVAEQRPKTPLPAPRPPPVAMPPTYNMTLPDAREALFPTTGGFRRLAKYVYPYLESVDDLMSGAKAGAHGYPYPDGYDMVQPLSDAGGDEGGNPDLWATYVTATVDVRNTGVREGKAVAQLYVAFPGAGAKTEGGGQDEDGAVALVDFPVKVLRGFDKTEVLAPGEAQTVTFNLTRRDLSYWDVRRQNWAMVTDGGPYRLLVGQSSQDLPLQGTW